MREHGVVSFGKLRGSISYFLATRSLQMTVEAAKILAKSSRHHYHTSLCERCLGRHCVGMCVLIFVCLRGKIHAAESCYEVIGRCEVRFSTSSQPDKNLYVCCSVCVNNLPKVVT